MQPPGTDFARALPQFAADVLSRVRRRGPRVHCITNTVAQELTANVLLAANALPSMTIAAAEIAAFADRADSLLVNLGTLDEERRAAVGIALDRADEKRMPWVLDPVLIDVSAPRAAFARTLLDRGPAAIRLNAREFAALAETAPDTAALARFASERHCAIGLTGETDDVADATRRVRIANGHALMARITAMGCAASALVAACLAVEKDAFLASASALLIFGVAGEIAGEEAQGPGSFATAFLDALYELDAGEIADRAEVE